MTKLHFIYQMGIAVIIAIGGFVGWRINDEQERRSGFNLRISRLCTRVCWRWSHNWCRPSQPFAENGVSRDAKRLKRATHFLRYATKHFVSPFRQRVTERERVGERAVLGAYLRAFWRRISEWIRCEHMFLP